MKKLENVLKYLKEEISQEESSKTKKYIEEQKKYIEYIYKHFIEKASGAAEKKVFSSADGDRTARAEYADVILHFASPPFQIVIFKNII